MYSGFLHSSKTNIFKLMETQPGDLNFFGNNLYIYLFFFFSADCESQCEKCTVQGTLQEMWQQRLTTINNIQSHVISLEQEHKQHRKITHRLTRHGSKWVPMFHNDSWNSFISVIDEKETGSSWLSQRLLGILPGPIADRHVSSNNPRNNCGTHFVSSSLLVSKIANSPRSIY